MNYTATIENKLVIFHSSRNNIVKNMFTCQNIGNAKKLTKITLAIDIFCVADFVQIAIFLCCRFRANNHCEFGQRLPAG